MTLPNPAVIAVVNVPPSPGVAEFERDLEATRRMFPYDPQCRYAVVRSLIAWRADEQTRRRRENNLFSVTHAELIHFTDAARAELTQFCKAMGYLPS